MFHSLDGNDVRTLTSNPGPHGNQALGQIHHFRFARSVFQNRRPRRQRRGHHQILGTRHRHGVHEYPRALQAGCRSHDIPMLNRQMGPHGLQSFQVQIHRTFADGTPPRQRDTGMPKSGQQRAQHQDGGTHGLDQIVGSQGFQGIRGAQNHFSVLSLDLHSHAPE